MSNYSPEPDPQGDIRPGATPEPGSEPNEGIDDLQDAPEDDGTED